MKHYPISTAGKQAGVSLIGMMIGLVISMLCILASLTLYKNLIHVAAESKLDTLYDGQLTSALMVSQIEIQNAGYGIEDAGTDHIKQNPSTDANGNSVNELLWRYFDGTNYVCEGLIEQTVAVTLSEDGTDEDYWYRELAMQQATSGCNETVDLATLTYSKTNVLARWQNVGVLATYVASNNLLSYTLDPAECSPFGAVARDRHLLLNITAPSSTTLNTAGTAENEIALCLPNTYPS